MKISKLFHWLYATLMFLPLLVAPIFGIYSHRHTIDGYSVVVPQNEVIDFNQLNKPINSVEFLDVSIETNDYEYTFNGISEGSGGRLNNLCQNLIQIHKGHKYYIKYVGTNNIIEFGLYLSNIGTYESIYVYSPNSIYNSTLDAQAILGVNFANDQVFDNDNCYISLFDLTQMFGSGNEPTIQQFESWFPDDYYEYTLSRIELLQVGTTTYDNTDIGSQFVYTIHNTIQNYFEMSDLFAFKGLSSWIQVAFFDGNFPLGFYIFYNLLLYWFVVSLLWLIFDVLMYVPNLAHRWLDRSSLQ